MLLIQGDGNANPSADQVDSDPILPNEFKDMRDNNCKTQLLSTAASPSPKAEALLKPLLLTVRFGQYHLTAFQPWRLGDRGLSGGFCRSTVTNTDTYIR